MANDVIDAEVTPATKSLSPKREGPGSIIDDINKIQRAFEKTRQFADNPEMVIDDRKLPKAGIEKMDFETEEYSRAVEGAKARVMK